MEAVLQQMFAEIVGMVPPEMTKRDDGAMVMSMPLSRELRLFYDEIVVVLRLVSENPKQVHAIATMKTDKSSASFHGDWVLDESSNRWVRG